MKSAWFCVCLSLVLGGSARAAVELRAEDPWPGLHSPRATDRPLHVRAHLLEERINEIDLHLANLEVDLKSSLEVGRASAFAGAWMLPMGLLGLSGFTVAALFGLQGDPTAAIFMVALGGALLVLAPLIPAIASATRLHQKEELEHERVAKEDELADIKLRLHAGG
ncbi:MAG TPA: hypothetical protein VH208_13960 [Myxococcaceae bacterium]|nr:hypothetical protein [Myxococcaceae bacterium]